MRAVAEDGGEDVKDLLGEFEVVEVYAVRVDAFGEDVITDRRRSSEEGVVQDLEEDSRVAINGTKRLGRGLLFFGVGLGEVQALEQVT